MEEKVIGAEQVMKQEATSLAGLFIGLVKLHCVACLCACVYVCVCKTWTPFTSIKFRSCHKAQNTAFTGIFYH